ncbi:MAG: glucosaminidase domain-containing protein [Ferruginibacter sp.]|nr:glucosaminidase domain-containing protein [Ferruginibacter sp.]
MKKFIFIAITIICSNVLVAQKITPNEYINTYRDIAIAEMKRSGIPASVTLAQGILETECGNSDLVKRSNNHFGIKCKSTWTGESVKHTDDAPNECFRKYSKPEESYKDHSDYLKTSPRYASLFELDPSDYKGWAFGLKKAGYATNPRYPQIVIFNIEKYNLQQYDNMTPEEVDNIAINQIATSQKVAVVETPVASIEQSIKLNTKFNGLKGLYASKGTSLLAIATMTDIDLAKLMEYNDLTTDGLLKDDQLIYLEKKPKQGNRDFYIALQKETLYDIAQNNAVQLKYLSQFNNMSSTETVQKGTKIKLRPTTSESLTLSK